jgi:predicted permease
MPGVTSAGFSAMPLLKGYAWQNAIVGKDFEGAPIEQQPVLSEIGPNYFATIGIPLISGREFTTRDEATDKYAVINEKFAKEYFPGRDPIGQLFGLVDDMQTIIPDTQVIGVISDKKYRDLRETPPPQAYFHYITGTHFRFMNIYLRTQGDPRLLEDAVRERMRQFDPHVPVVDLVTMDELIGQSLRTERLVASLSAVFGALATTLSVIGLYGVLAYVVMRRKSEIGIRMALGALKPDVIWLVMREVLILVAAGLLVGIPLTFALSSLVRSQLFGLDPHDPLTLTSAIVGLTFVACLAGLLPALKASRIDPLQSLRDE